MVLAALRPYSSGSAEATLCRNLLSFDAAPILVLRNELVKHFLDGHKILTAVKNVCKQVLLDNQEKLRVF
jgi:hypothetical protein